MAAADLEAEPLSETEERAYAMGLERRRRRGLWAIVLFTPWLWPLAWRVRDRGKRRDEESGEG